MSARISRLFTCTLAANLAGLVLIAAWVLLNAYPASEAVRLRNALLFTVGSAQDFEWTPDRVPADFKLARLAPDPVFLVALRAANVDAAAGDWGKALAIAGYLTRNTNDTGAIRSDLVNTLTRIVDEGAGYCADYTEVYLALAWAAGLVARQWAFSLDGYGGRGHTLVEVFDRKRQRWGIIDVFNNVHPVDAASGQPLPALEFRKRMRDRGDRVRIVRNGPGRLGYPVEDKLLDYYRRGAEQWYLWWGNAVFTYDRHPLVRAAGSVSRPLEQLAAIAVGVHPGIRAVRTEHNARQIGEMLELRSRLMLAAIAFAALLATLVAQFALRMRVGRAAESAA